MPTCRKFCLLALAALTLMGCKSTYSEKDNTAGPPPLLRNSSRIYIAVPLDASYKKQVAQGSGKQTAQAVHAALAKYSRVVFIGKIPESTEEALESARRANAEYMIYPHIVNWEDHATEYSGRRDRLDLKLDLIDARDGSLAFSREINATGKWLSDGGDTPGDLLEQPVEEYANTLFRRVEKPSALW
jgi:hypothetical protein